MTRGHDHAHSAGTEDPIHTVFAGNEIPLADSDVGFGGRMHRRTISPRHRRGVASKPRFTDLQTAPIPENHAAFTPQRSGCPPPAVFSSLRVALFERRHVLRDHAEKALGARRRTGIEFDTGDREVRADAGALEDALFRLRDG